MTDRSLAILAVLALLAATAPALSQPAPDKDKLAERARAVLVTHCQRCHKGEGSEGGDADFLKRADLVAPRKDEKPLVKAGKPGESLIFERLAVRKGGKGDMPPKSVRDRPSDSDKAIIKQWIESGAPDFPKEEARKFISLADVLTAIRDDLRNRKKVPREKRKNQRYFTLTHLHNNPNVRAEHLRLVRAALAKVINSLSWRPEAVPVRVVDKAQTILAVDISKLDWTRHHWRAILRAYPYGLSYGSHRDRDLRDLDEDIVKEAGRDVELVHVRGDWFVSTASRPPLYHTLLYDMHLPVLEDRKDDSKSPANPKRMTAIDLEDYLGVHILDDLRAREPRARRAGFTRSGVSGQNRLIERHPLGKRAGAYWKSYDFKATTWEANLLQFPLGPRFAKNEFKDLAFVHDGGEIIFNLPNGLQGYLLIDGKDNRIDAGPIEVVSDALKTSGTPAIANGLSCMACHKHGMVDPPRDLVREGTGLEGKVLDRVEQLYPPAKEMTGLIRQDVKRFLTALDRSAGEFLKVGAEKDRPIREFIEPVGEVARKYLLDDLDLTTVAAELFVANPKNLQTKIRENEKLRRLGLGALLREGGLIKRGAWESVRGSSQMQQTARELGFTSVKAGG
jgi:serine/threonine-protein kinase